VKPLGKRKTTARRCLIPADGFYEWQKLDAKTKQPYAIVMKDRSLFGFAGLWERWKDKASGEVVRSFTIITTTPQQTRGRSPRPSPTRQGSTRTFCA
jgi:putative SOS response-associated peptidase YedK